MVRKTVTLVFCDVADSTPLGERLDPEALRGVWSRYHETARDVLERHGGTIEKFVGDAVLGVFGIPVVHEDDALRAVRAAVELRDELARLNDELGHVYGVRIDVRTGINTGEVFAGDPAHGDPFATGDAVVVAQRLEANAAGGEILVGDPTIRLVRAAVTAEQIQPLVLKGKSEPIAAWRLLDVEPGVAGVSRRMDSPFVDRHAELARLREEFARADTERTCRVVTVLGEPGVGKSRLAAELVASVAEPTLVLEGRCLPYGKGVTYWPLVEIVDGLDLERVLAGEPDGEIVRRRLLEAVGRADPTSRSDELYWAVRRLLETLARERTVVVVLDDVQWAEPAFLDLIEYLAGWSRDAPILLCCLARSDLAELRPSLAGSVTIEVAPLAQGDARELLENLAGPLDPAAAAAVGRATGGNPLFLEEMLRMLVEDGVLVEHNGRLQSLEEVESLRVPETVQAVLAARLALLDAAELAVLQRAAVIGQVFWWGAVADLTPTEQRGGVAAQLQALVRKGLVRPDLRTFAGEDGFRFGHILIRDATYESMPKRLRGELHERFADWVEERAGEADLDEILGHHLEQAYAYSVELGSRGEREAALAERASMTLSRAGRRALAREDPHAAVTLLGRALDLLDPEATDVAALRLDRAGALYRAGDYAGAVALFERLLADDVPAGVGASAGLELAFARMASGDGSVGEVLEAADRAATTFAELGDQAGLAQTWFSVAMQFFWRGLMAQMEGAAVHALEHARAAGDERYESAALNAICIALCYGPTHADAAAAQCRDLLERSEEIGGGAVPLFLLAGLEAMRGRPAKAWELYERGVARGVAGMRTGVPVYAQPLFELDPHRAEPELRQTIRTLDAQGIRTGRETAVIMLAEALLAIGAHDEAAMLMATRLPPDPTEDVATRILWLRAEARVDADGQGAARAREAVALAREAESPHFLAGTLAVLASLVAGVERDAAATEALALYDAKGNTAGAALFAQGLDIRSETR